MNAMQPQMEHLSDVEDIKREPKKHCSHYSKKELDPSTTRHTDTKVTLPPHHTRAVTAAMAVRAVIPKEEKVKVMWDANPAWTWHLVNYFEENISKTPYALEKQFIPEPPGASRGSREMDLLPESSGGLWRSRPSSRGSGETDLPPEAPEKQTFLQSLQRNCQSPSWDGARQ